VVQTNGFRDDLWMDLAGAPLTAAATVTERFHRPNFGALEIEATVNDPKAYTRAWTVKIPLKVVLDTELIDEICLENEKSAAHESAVTVRGAVVHSCGHPTQSRAILVWYRNRRLTEWPNPSWTFCREPWT
jgi:hypothetical protein